MGDQDENSTYVSAFIMYKSMNKTSQSKKRPGKQVSKKAKKQKVQNGAAKQKPKEHSNQKTATKSKTISRSFNIDKKKQLKSNGVKSERVHTAPAPELIYARSSKNDSLEEEYTILETSNSGDEFETELEESQETSSDNQQTPTQKKKNEKFQPITTSSEVVGETIFKWLVSPTNFRKFMDHIWEKKPLHVNRGTSDYYKHIISTTLIDEMLRTERILYSEHLDVTSYTAGVKEVHNPEGRAMPHTVWDYYVNGCTIRLLSPQSFLPNVHAVLANLQEYTGCFVGANTYLTPPNTQGFAPHYDDIEAFILQIEGKKLWRVYAPLDRNDTLPRSYSKDYAQDELGKPIMEVTLEAGDLLYFPRGFIHQAEALPDCHSLHLTISMYQKNAWADLFEKMLPEALSQAITANPEFRKGLPMAMHRKFGYANMNSTSNDRTECLKTVKHLFDKVFKYLDVDRGVDLMMKKFQAEALPPVLSEAEKATTVYGKNSIMGSDGKVRSLVYFDAGTCVRLLRRNVLRVMKENGSLKVYYSSANMLFHPGCDDAEPRWLEVEEQLETALSTLLNTYPAYVKVVDLPGAQVDMIFHMCLSLWEVGILMMKYPPKF